MRSQRTPITAPSYAKARTAVEQLKNEGSISRGEQGFDAVADIIERRIAEHNKRVPRTAIVLESLEATGGGTIAFGPTVSRQVAGLSMIFRGQQQPVEWDLLVLSEAVEESWKQRSLSWATYLFWVGIVQTV